jgi:hypothetical protein
MRLPIEPESRWEVGSEFHWQSSFPPPLLTWPENSRWYVLARHALAALLMESSHAPPTLWLPSYFCGEVTDFCRDYCKIREYRDDPRWPEPDWDSLRPSGHDFVLAVNYFGVRDGFVWRRWKQCNECLLVEDHTQDPFSSWCQCSTADYAIASLRKTLPIADGALLWSPKGLALPQQPREGDWTGSALKLAAMLRKSQYLESYGVDDLKPLFRRLQADGENFMRNTGPSSISPYSYALISAGFPACWRNQRELNARSLTARLADWNAADLLFRIWPSGAVPFAAVLIFTSQSERDQFQARMIQKNVYCAVHWICRTEQKHALDLSSRILSVPIDHRYNEYDMHRLADVALECLNPVSSESRVKAGCA